jgi:hypothetical protein
MTKLQPRCVFIGTRKFKIAGLAPRLVLLIALAIGSQVLITGTANSTSVSASLFDTVTKTSDQFNSATLNSLSLPNIDTVNQVGHAESHIFLGPTGAVSASASGFGTVNAGAGAELDYHLIVTGPSSSALVPVGVLAVITTSFSSGVNATSNASINVNGTVRNGHDGTGFNSEIQLLLTPGTYQVPLRADAAGFGDGGSASASADPHFFIDLSFDPTFDPTGYSLSLDGGVGNGIPPDFGTSATPLPAALPLFATGLGALGLLGWHRKRKAQLTA